MRLLIMGPPGAGKGTQAARIADLAKIPHISTGDIFRGALQSGSELGKRLKQYLDSGQLVPDQVTVETVRQRLQEPDCRGGFLLDGFPRNLAQAEALDQILDQMSAKLNAVLNIAVEAKVLMKRLTGRRICRQCGAPYHIEFQPPRVAGVCDHCGGELYQRSDDQPETVSGRIKVYEEQTAPLLTYYRRQGTLREINGELPIEEVWQRIEEILRRLPQ